MFYSIDLYHSIFTLFLLNLILLNLKEIIMKNFYYLIPLIYFLFIVGCNTEKNERKE